MEKVVGKRGKFECEDEFVFSNAEVWTTTISPSFRITAHKKKKNKREGDGHIMLDYCIFFSPERLSFATSAGVRDLYHFSVNPVTCLRTARLCIDRVVIVDGALFETARLS